MSELLKTISFILESLIVLLLFFTPFVVSNELYNGLITAKEFWFFGVIALILLYWATSLLFTKQIIGIDLNLPDVLLLTFYTWCFIRACYTPYTPVLYNHKLQMLTGGMVVYFFIKWTIQTFKPSNNQTIEPSNPQTIYYPIIIAFLISGLFQAVYGLLQLYGYYPSNHNLFKITGSFFNPAPFALYLAVAFPMALGTYFYTLHKLKSERSTKLETCASTQTSDQNIEQQTGNSEQKTLNRKHKTLQLLFKQSNFQTFKLLFKPSNHHILKLYILQYISLATLIAILLVLPATMIRASWLGAMAGSILTFWIAIKKGMITIPTWAKDLIRNKIYKSVIIIIAFGLVSLSCLFLFKVKEESSIGKSLIWEVTLGKIAEKPLFGHGLGRFEAEYNNWQAQYFHDNPSEMEGPKGLAAGNTKYCFNDYLEIASETGAFGLLLFLGAIGSIVFYGSRLGKYGQTIADQMAIQSKDENSKTTNDHRMTDLIHLPALISLIICAAISYPFYNIPTLLLLFVLLGSVSSATNNIKFKAKLLFRFAIAPVMVFCSFVLALEQYGKIKAYKGWLEANYVYELFGAYGDANKIYNSNFVDLKYEDIFLQQYGKSLLMSGQNTNAKIILEQASHLTSDYVLYCTLGDVYKAEKEFTKAENSYSFACFMEPHKLYPNYMLAKLFNESGQREKAILKANEVLAKSPKTESIAVKEIKNEMKKLKNDYIIKQLP